MFQLYLSTAGLLNILKHLFWGCNLFLRILCVHGGTEETWHAVSFSQSAGNQPTRLPPSTTSCEPAPMPQCHHHCLPTPPTALTLPPSQVSHMAGNVCPLPFLHISPAPFCASSPCCCSLVLKLLQWGASVVLKGAECG